MWQVLISERLIFLKLVFNAFYSRFQSDKHLLITKEQPYFSVWKSQLFSRCVLIGPILWNWLVSICWKVVLKLFILSSSRQSLIKNTFWSVIKSFSFRIFNFCISFKTGALLGKKFIILIAFSCNCSNFLN